MERANSCPSFFELFKTAPGTRKQDPEQTEPGRLDRQGLKWGNFPRSSTAGVTAGERRKRPFQPENSQAGGPAFDSSRSQDHER